MNDSLARQESNSEKKSDVQKKHGLISGV